MKRIYSYLESLLLLIFAFSACTPEDFVHPDPNGIPLATDIDVDIAVDQEINQVTFTLKNKACMPVWIFDGKTYSTVNGLSKIYAEAGTYEVEIKMANSNGVSDASITKSFTIENAIVDFDSYITRMAGSADKEWMIAKETEGHLACGDSGTDGTNYYSAAPNEHAAFGLYDDVLTFGTDKSYIYNPGAGGTVYVNKGCSIFGEFNPQDGKDFMATVEEQKVNYDFVVEGNDVFITFPSKTLFPYIANDDAYNTPKYKIVSLTPTKMELIADNGEIAWHYILASGEETKPGGYDADNACNMWKTATFTNEFFYAPGWGQIADPAFEANGNSYKITLSTATSDQWQAQVKFLTDITTNSSTNYDFSTIFTSTKDHNNVTVKLVQTGNDGNFYFTESIKLKAYEDYVFIMTDMPGIDMDNVSLVLDFGGNVENTEVTVSRVVLKEHGCDDGTIVETPGEEEDVIWLPDAASNMWKSASFTNEFYYAPGWTQIADPGFVADGNSYKISLPVATTDQWQAQVKFLTDMTTSSATAYDFRCILNSTEDMTGVTVKLVSSSDDADFYFAERVDLVAYQDYVFKQPNMPGIDMDAVTLVFDFGGNPAGVDVTVSSVILQEHGAGKVSWNPDSDCNMWKASQFTNTFYYAPGWVQIADPVLEADNGSYTITLPEATMAQWQAQFVFHTDITTNSSTSYDFHCILRSTKDMTGATVKLVLDGEGNDGNFYFTERADLTADEDYVLEMPSLPGKDMDKVSLVLDFGGNPANMEVTVSSIILKESSCNN
ncbi:MAG: hypothetical protein LUE99_18460 [Bacteroides sp.]|nr:hypothetical protein [Bacteroides sp.]